jgi:hypothetical protein
VIKAEIGHVSINPADARRVMPELPSSRESVFVRLSLAENSAEKIKYHCQGQAGITFSSSSMVLAEEGKNKPLMF